MFGDFAAAASASLARAVSLADPATAGWAARRTTAYAGEIEQALGSLILVLGHYLEDNGTVTGPGPTRRMPVAWEHARAQARLDLARLSRQLAPDMRPGAPHGPRHSENENAVSHSLRSAATAATAGRDLLQTHWLAGADGTWNGRSEWVPVLTSQPVRTALVAEVGRWARLIDTCAWHTAAVSIPDERRDSDSAQAAQVQRRLRLASDSLRKLQQPIKTAQKRQPVTAADTRLLHAIPVNALPARRFPYGRETAGDLCQGAIDSAERVRHLAFTSVPDQRWPPDLTASALRETAGCATAISHHCSIMLRTLAAHPAVRDPALREGLARSAAAAEQSRDAWLRAARSWKDFASQEHADASALRAETSDLALWTGRLAYADSAWTLADGPKRPARPPASLAAEPGDIALVVAAAHQACDSVAQLAAANDQHIRHGIETGSFYVPTDRLPWHLRTPRPFALALPLYLTPVVTKYEKARQASTRAVASVAENSFATNAPTTTLAVARAAARSPGRKLTADDAAIVDHPTVRTARSQLAEPPGHYEQMLSSLGEADPEVLKRAAAIDQAGEQLIVERARTAQPPDLGKEIAEAYKTLGLSKRIHGRQAPLRPASPARERIATLDHEAEL